MSTGPVSGPHLGQTGAADIRESLRRLPGFLQLPLTLLTGKAHTGQVGPRAGPTYHLLTAVCSVIVGLAVSGLAFRAGLPWIGPALVVGWAITLHGMRNLRMMIFHQCAHGNMWRRPVDRVVGRVVAGLLVVQGFDGYRKEHVVDHHAAHHMTPRDPTVQAFLVTLGLGPGLSRRQMWSRLLIKLFSPIYHLRFTVARVRSYWAFESPQVRWLTVLGYGALAVLLTLTGGWLFFLIAWVLPLTVFFQISNTLRLCVKHTFPKRGEENGRGRDYFAGLTNAIFLGCAPPAERSSRPRLAVAWSGWWARMLFIHFPSRYLVLTGDTVCHDYHHRYPMAKDWADYIFARQRDIDRGNPGWPDYQEAWGLRQAINRVFDSLSTADPDIYSTASVGRVSDRSLFAAFDD